MFHADPGNCVCVCRTPYPGVLYSIINLNTLCRRPGRIHRRLVSEADDVSEDMEMGRHFHIPPLLIRETEGNCTRHTCASVPFLLLSLLWSTLPGRFRSLTIARN